MKILVLGSGAREHAIILALRSEETEHEIFAAPGNAGIGQDAQLVALDVNDPAAVTVFANENDIDLVVIGPEAPLVAGVADAVREHGIPVFGPGRAAAQLEGSKAFAKRIMDAAGVPTGRARRAASRAEVEAAFDELGARNARFATDPRRYGHLAEHRVIVVDLEDPRRFEQGRLQAAVFTVLALPCFVVPAEWASPG